MLFQDASSENTFIVVLVILAAILVVIILTVVFAILRGESRIRKIRETGERIPDAALLPEVVSLSEEQSESIPAENLLNLIPIDETKAGEESETTLEPAAAVTSTEVKAAPGELDESMIHMVPEDGTKNESNVAPLRFGTTTGVLLTAILLFGLIGIPQVVYSRSILGILAGNESPFFIIGWGLISAAISGFVGIRIAGLSWRQLIRAGMLAGLGVAMTGVEFYRFFSGSTSTMLVVIAFLLLAPLPFIYSSAGLFLLPLFDPKLRESGPAPSPWIVLLAGFWLAAFYTIAMSRDGGMAALEWSGSMRTFKFVVAILAIFVIGPALIWGLNKPEDKAGAGLGAIAVIFVLFMILISVFVQ